MTPNETKLHVLVISSMFESALVGREMTINLARHVLAGYNSKEPQHLDLLQQVILHFVTINHKFENVYAQFQNK